MPQEYDLRRMQEEAARRAREMQARARQAAPVSRPPTAPAPESPPPAPPAAPVSESAPVSPLSSTETPVPMTAAGGHPLDALFQDRERTIILALLVLLSGEEGNHELLFALMFLLM